MGTGLTATYYDGSCKAFEMSYFILSFLNLGSISCKPAAFSNMGLEMTRIH